MKEFDFINIIKNTIDDSSLIGDDCAYLEDFDMFVTQDTLVEDVHFSMHTTTPYLLGRKSVSVNFSDLAAALALPKFISISLSLPAMTKDSFVSEFYRGVNEVCKEYGVKISGGDITGGEKIVVSICALGKRESLFFASRKNAKKGDVIVVTGEFGSSGAGLYALSDFLYCDEELKNKHLNPTPRIKEAKTIANLTDTNIASTDCSDGLICALYNIATESKHSLKIDLESIPVNKKMLEFCKTNNLNADNFIKWGAEDYELLLCIPEELYKKLDPEIFVKIGTVLNKDTTPTITVKNGDKTEIVDKSVMEKSAFNHFDR